MLDADLAAAFDRIDHSHLLAAQIGGSRLGNSSSGGSEQVWSRKVVLRSTEEGTPQGGVISPLLLNVALHGMEDAAGVRYQTLGVERRVDDAGQPRDGALRRRPGGTVRQPRTGREVKARLAAWLAPRGLAFNEDKTRIVHLDDGFDFLGFNVRRYRGKLLIKPSKAALRRHRERLAAEMKALRGANAAGGAPTTEPDHSGMVGLLPDGGVQRGVRQAGRSTCGSSPTSGPSRSHRNKSKRWVVRTATSAVQHVPT